MGLCEVVSSREIWLNRISELRPRNKIYQKIQRKKLKILRKYDIENYKVFKKSYMNENDGLIVIDMSSVENIPDSRMTQGENK